MKEGEIVVKENTNNGNANSFKSLFQSDFSGNKFDGETLVSYALKYSKLGFKIFPCNKDKTPISDSSIGLTHGLRAATNDPKTIAKWWHVYPEASIGLALDEDIIVLDADVKKDSAKTPILKEGKPIQIGMTSISKLLSELGDDEEILNTLATRTQSGGFQFFFKLSGGFKSFNHTAALNGLDIKGHGGYVIVPPSQGVFGRYEFKILEEIKPLPEHLFDWILEVRGQSKGKQPDISNSEELQAHADEVDVEEIVDILLPYWEKADGRRNALTLAIDGSLARMDVSIKERKKVIKALSDRSGKGHDHISAVGYSERRLSSGERVLGFSSLERLIDELEGE